MRDRKSFPFLGRKHPSSRGNLQIDREQQRQPVERRLATPRR